MGKTSFNTGDRYSLKAEIIILLLFILSILLFFPAINLLSNTVLPFIYVLLVPVTGVLLAWLCLYRTSPYHIAWNIFLSFAIGGVISLFLMVFINKQFPQKSPIIESFDVMNYGNKRAVTGRLASNCDLPYVTILIQGKRKSLELTCQDQESLESYEKVECNYSIGCFGWAYIHNYIAKKWE